MSFKSKAKQHQLNYFQNSENQSLFKKRLGRAQAHWLNEDSASKGRIFYSGYGIFDFAKNKRSVKNNTPEWYYDTLRSQHIPYNFFVPFLIEKELAIKVFNELLKLNIISIEEIKIEYPPRKLNTLGDNTSFDVFIDYTNNEGEKCFLGIEVKYTEGGYSPTNKEKSLLNKEDSIYRKVTSGSKLYFSKKPKFFENVSKNSYRQIWRNHILAYTFAKKYNYEEFKSITIFHEGNNHFSNAFKEYDIFLNDKGKKTLSSLTYSEFIKTLRKYHSSASQKKWIDYLENRYKIV